MANAVVTSRARSAEITAAIRLANRLLWICSAMVIGGIGFFGASMYLSSGVLFAAGLGSYAVLLLSWHYYRLRTSVFAWLVFSAAIAISLVVGIVLPTVREGFLHPLGALFAMVGGLGLGIAAPITISAPRLRKWASE